MKDDELIEIVRKYTEYFKLTLSEDSKSLKVYDSALVGYLAKEDKKYFRYWGDRKWRECKTTDLMIAIVENIPLHESGNVL